MALKMISQTGERVLKVISDTSDNCIDDIKFDDSFADNLGIESLDFYELVMNIEKEFGVSIPDEDLELIPTVQQMIEYVEKKYTTIHSQH